MKEYYMLVEQDEEGWFVGSVPELPGCHTQGRTIEELATRMREAVELWLENSPVVASMNFVGVHRVAVS